MATPPSWATTTLRLAGLYNLVWGSWVVLRPNDWFVWVGINPPQYLGIWQCVGMIVGVYGVGYWVAARDPLRHWPIVLVGFLGKVFGPIGFLYTRWTVAPEEPGYLPWRFGLINITNDLIWWVPFAAILYLAWKAAAAPAAAEGTLPLARALAVGRDQFGRSIGERSREGRQLVVFLRHGGCTFCREALADLAEQRAEIEASGAGIILVHLSSEASGRQLAARYGLEDLPRIADPTTQLYRAFGLPRGAWWQLFGRGVWWRGFQAGILRGHGIGKMDGDGFQMPGAFVVEGERIVTTFQHQDAADRPDYAKLVNARGAST